ncbi:MAG: hypothetical protein KatS3mg010_0337 [Acidimicrobiia bacterium]|nr:MAG: hypothetical protein KatS3mg010_0337 [Acidimicrobiia bacterium]
MLTDLGVPTGGLAIRDGSGLHPDNRVACETLLAVLRLPGPRFDALDDGLAVAARTGTLRTRVPPDDPLAGVLRAKTGQIRGVASLAGVVDDAEGLRFAFESAGAFSTSEGNAHQAGVARLVAAYPEAPPCVRARPRAVTGAPRRSPRTGCDRARPGRRLHDSTSEGPAAASGGGAWRRTRSRRSGS